MTPETNSLPKPYEAMVREVVRELNGESYHRHGIILDGTGLQESQLPYLQQMAQALQPYMTNGRQAITVDIPPETSFDSLEKIVNEKNVFGIFIVRNPPTEKRGTVFDGTGPVTRDQSRLSDVPHYYNVDVSKWLACQR